MTKKAHEVLGRYADKTAWAGDEFYLLLFNNACQISKLTPSDERVIDILEGARKSMNEQLDHIIGELK